MNQAQDMLKNMLIMTIADVKSMHGLTHDDVVAVLTEVSNDPALEDFDKTEEAEVVPAVAPVTDPMPPAENAGRTVNITDVDNVVIETTEEVETKPKKRAAKK